MNVCICKFCIISRVCVPVAFTSTQSKSNNAHPLLQYACISLRSISFFPLWGFDLFFYLFPTKVALLFQMVSCSREKLWCGWTAVLIIIPQAILKMACSISHSLESKEWRHVLLLCCCFFCFSLVLLFPFFLAFLWSLNVKIPWIGCRPWLGLGQVGRWGLLAGRQWQVVCGKHHNAKGRDDRRLDCSCKKKTEGTTHLWSLASPKQIFKLVCINHGYCENLRHQTQGRVHSTPKLSEMGICFI